MTHHIESCRVRLGMILCLAVLASAISSPAQEQRKPSAEQITLEQVYRELKAIRSILDHQNATINDFHEAFEPFLADMKKKARRARQEAKKDVDLAMEVVLQSSWDEKFSNRLLFLPGTQRLVLAYKDKTLRLVDVPSGEPSGRLTGLDAAAGCLAATADGRTLFAGTPKGSVYMWQMDCPKAAKVIDTEGWPVDSLAVSPDGSLIAWATNGKYGDDGKWTEPKESSALVNVKTGKRLFGLPVGRGDYQALSFAGDGKVLAVVQNREAVLVDAATGKIKFRLEDKEYQSGPLSVAYSPRGDVVAIGYAPYHVGLWDAQKGTPLKLLEGHSNWVVALDFTSDGTRLVSSAGDSTASVWDVGSGTEIGRFRFGDGPTYVEGLSVSWQDSFVAMGRHGEYVVCRMPAALPKK